MGTGSLGEANEQVDEVEETGILEENGVILAYWKIP
jgi:hypothetical protein